MSPCPRRAAALALLLCACGRKPADAAYDAGGEAPAATVTAAIDVSVQPPDGISIWLDDSRVAVRSPYRATGLAPGAHTLHVRGMGYLPVTLPVTLRPLETVQVPVSLRPRPHVEEMPEALPEAAVASGPPPRRERAARPPEVPIELPAGVAPVELHLVPQPPVPLLVDGARVDGRALRLHRVRGVLQVGSMLLGYAIDVGRVLELTIPDDDASWSKDGTALPGGAVVRLSYGVARLARLGGGREQVLLLRRAT